MASFSEEEQMLEGDEEGFYTEPESPENVEVFRRPNFIIQRRGAIPNILIPNDGITNYVIDNNDQPIPSTSRRRHAEQVPENQQPKQRKQKFTISDRLQVQCHWSNCLFETNDVHDYNHHLSIYHECDICGNSFEYLQAHLPCPEEGEATTQYGRGARNENNLDGLEFEPEEEDEENQFLFTLRERGNRGAFEIYEYKPTMRFVDISDLMEYVYEPMVELLEHKMRGNKVISLQMRLVVNMCDVNTGEIYEIDPNTVTTRITHKRFITSRICELVLYLLKKIELYNEFGSGFSVDDIEVLELYIGRVNSIRAGKFIEIPEFLKKSRGLLNIKTDHFCFHYCIIANFFRNVALERYKRIKEINNQPYDKTNKNVPRQMETLLHIYHPFWKKFNFDELTSNVDLLDIDRFQETNGISVAVFGIAEPDEIVCIRPIQTLKNKHVNLLFLQEQDKGHFVLITDLDKFLNRHDRVRHLFCHFCFKKFRKTETLQRHEEKCLLNSEVKPPELFEKFREFKNYEHTIPFPFTLYYDYESYLISTNEVESNSENETDSNEEDQRFKKRKPVVKYKHVAAGYCLALYSLENGLEFCKTYYGKNVIDHFLDTVLKIQDHVMLKIKNTNYPIQMTGDQEREHDNSTICTMCCKPYTENNRKVKHHSHFKKNDNYLFSCCNNCNLKMRKKQLLPVLGHNAIRYDNHLIVKGLKRKFVKRLHIIPKNEEKFISFRINKLKFLDSFNFQPASLKVLAKSLLKSGRDNFKATIQFFKQKYNATDQAINLILQKQIFPYSFMSGPECFKYKQLPTIDKFYDHLKGKQISQKKYDHAKLVWDTFKCKTFKDYVRLYNQVDTLILLDCMEHFRQEGIKAHDLDCLHSFSTPGYSFQCALYKSRIRLEYLKDEEATRLLNQSMYGGPVFLCKRLSTANSELLQNFDPSKPRTHIAYVDFSALYSSILCMDLPYGGFFWESKLFIQQLNNNKLADGSIDSSYFLNLIENTGQGKAITLDLEYPKELHNSTMDLPLLISHMDITLDDLSPLQLKILKSQGKFSSNLAVGKRLTMNLHDKFEYTVHYKVLKLYLKLGIKIKKVHSIFNFKEKAYMKDYIESNISKRLATSVEFLNMLYKLLNNSCGGKMMMRDDKYINVEIALTKKRAIQLLSRPGLKNFYKLNDEASFFSFHRLTQPKRNIWYTGWAVLQLAKMKLYEAWHCGFRKEFGENATLLYGDTDSLIVEIIDEENNYFTKMKNLHWLFDFSNFPENHELYSTINKGKIGVLKYVEPKRGILEFCGTSSKQYSIRRVEEEISSRKVQKKFCERKSKGLPTRIIHHNLRHENYVNAVKNTNLNKTTKQIYKQERHKFHMIRSRRHKLTTVLVNKIGISPFDPKRWLKSCGILTLPHGHYSIKQM